MENKANFLDADILWLGNSKQPVNEPLVVVCLDVPYQPHSNLCVSSGSKSEILREDEICVSFQAIINISGMMFLWFGDTQSHQIYRN